MKKYTKEHEWIQIEGNIATIGITNHAQEQLGELVYVEMPSVGDEFTRGDAVAVVESVKTASDVYAPLDGSITEVNEEVEGDAALVNKSAETDGWLFKMEFSDASQLEELLDQEEIE